MINMQCDNDYEEDFLDYKILPCFSQPDLKSFRSLSGPSTQSKLQNYVTG